MKKILLCCALLTGIVATNVLSSCSCEKENKGTDEDKNKPSDDVVDYPECFN